MCRRTLAPLALVAVVVVCGCFEPSKPQGLEPFEKYATTPLQAGVGWGDLVLGTTTLAEVAEKLPVHKGLGKSPVSVALGDEVFVEIAYGHGQVCLGFPATGACKDVLIKPEGHKLIARNVAAFLKKYPACNAMTLTSISVGAGETRETTLFTGATDEGVKLWGMAELVKDHGPAVPRTSAGGIAGMDEGLTKGLQHVTFGKGIWFHIRPENEAPAAEPSEEAAAPLTGHVARITIFVP